MFKILAPLIGALSLIAFMWEAPVRLSVTGGATVIGDSVMMGTRTVVKNFIVGRDTVRFMSRRNDTTLVTRRRIVFRDSVMVAAPLPGTRAIYKGCVQVERDGRNSGKIYPSTGAKCWVDTVETAPDPVVDSVLQLSRLIVKPDTISLTYGAKTQFCAFLKFKNGKIAMRTTDDSDTCLREYAKFPLTSRDVSGAQQLIADATCVSWKATGGSITSEVCTSTLGLKSS